MKEGTDLGESQVKEHEERDRERKVNKEGDERESCG